MGSGPLDSTKEAYQVVTECFKIAQEVIRQQQANLFTHSSWPTQPNAQQDIDQARLEARAFGVRNLFRFGRNKFRTPKPF